MKAQIFWYGHPDATKVIQPLYVTSLKKQASTQDGVGNQQVLSVECASIEEACSIITTMKGFLKTHYGVSADAMIDGMSLQSVLLKLKEGLRVVLSG